jgi:hypothetical protein
VTEATRCELRQLALRATSFAEVSACAVLRNSRKRIVDAPGDAWGIEICSNDYWNIFGRDVMRNETAALRKILTANFIELLLFLHSPKFYGVVINYELAFEIISNSLKRGSPTFHSC